eukprot:Partr_v1_DN27409_c3_g1_i3_m71695 putative Fatty acid desaturase
MTIAAAVQVNDHNILDVLHSSQPDVKVTAPIPVKPFLRRQYSALDSSASWIPQSWCRRYIHPWIEDERDTVFVIQSLYMLVTVVPSIVCLWMSVVPSWWQALLHLALVVPWMGPYTLMLHCTSHRRLYKLSTSHGWWLNSIVPHVLGPMFGQTWNTYYFHHVKHHHVEDNGPGDLSSTLLYQRDSFKDFLLYFARFFFLIGLELPVYFLRKGQFSTVALGLFGEYGMVAGMYYLSTVRPWAILVAFWIPFLLSRLGMMSGNWAQHAFIDHENPQSNYKSALCCMHHMYNVECVNDGYHISHHLNARRHWSDHPAYIVQNRDVYAEKGAIMFRDIDFHGVFLKLMLGKYDQLADLFVYTGPRERRPSHQEIVTMLKDRTRRFTRAEVAQIYSTPPTQSRKKKSN